MAVNRYDQPLQTEFINTYSPIPFDDMMKVGMLKRAEIDKGEQKAADLMGKLQAIKVRGEDEQDYQTRIRDMENRLDETISKYGNLGTVEARRAVSKLISEQQQDSWWRAAATNYATAQSIQEDIRKKREEKGYSWADTYDAESYLQQAGSTSSMMERDGVGFMSSPNTFSASDYREEMTGWVDKMKASGQLTEFTDATGQYKITKENSGLFADKVGSVFGIQFAKNPTTGKYGIDMDNLNIPIQFLTSSASGQKMLREADIKVRQLVEAGAIAPEEAGAAKEQLAKEMYADTALSIINASTFGNTKDMFEADPYALQAAKAKIDDMDIPWSYSVLAGTSASKINSIDTLQTTKSMFEEEVKQVQANKAEFVKNYEIELANGTSRITNEEYSQQLHKFDLEEQQAAKKRSDLDNLERRTKLSVGLKEDYEPNQEIITKSRELAEKAAARMGFANPKTTNQNIRPLSESDRKDWDTAVKNQFNKILQEQDPMLAKYNKALEENAKAGVTTLGATRFTSKTLNETAEKDFNRYIAEGSGNRLSGGTQGLQFMGNREDFTDKDYENLSIEKDAEFLGWAYDHESEAVKFIYRPYSKDGKLMQPVWGEAPQGAETHLIRSGAITQAQSVLHRQMVKAETSPDYADDVNLAKDAEGRFILGDATSEFAGKYRSLRRSEADVRSGQPGYELVLKEMNSKTGKIENVAYQFNTRDEVINRYIQYINDAYSAPVK